MLICYLKQVSSWANSYFLQYTESSPLLLYRYILQNAETRVTIVDKSLSCLRNQAQSLERGTQHYLKFQTLDTQVLPSPLSLTGTLLTWLALVKAYPCLPSHPKPVHALNFVVATQCWDKKQLKHRKTTKAVASPTMKSFCPLPILLQMELKILFIEGQTSAQTSTDIHRGITGSHKRIFYKTLQFTFFPGSSLILL